MKEYQQLMGKIEVALQRLQIEYGDVEINLLSKYNFIILLAFLMFGLTMFFRFFGSH